MLNFQNCEKEYVASNENNILASVSHDLRNPLSAIIHAAEFLEEDNQNTLNPDSICLLKSIKDSSKEALEMVSDLLDVLQINSGKFNANLDHKIDIKEIIKRCIQLTHNLYYKKQININFTTEDNLPNIHLDNRRMKQILINIISNSVKYSKDKTEITINTKVITKLNDKFLQITVKDQGFGMSPEELKLSLKDYKVVDDRRIDSFGLGMSLIKQLVEAQNGYMLIKSKKNVGTKFYLNFPIK